jgi:hypothetical protein
MQLLKSRRSRPWRANDLNAGDGEGVYDNESCETHPATMDAIRLTTIQDRYQLYLPLAENEIRIFEILPGLEGDVV